MHNIWGRLRLTNLVILNPDTCFIRFQKFYWLLELEHKFCYREWCNTCFQTTRQHVLWFGLSLKNQLLHVWCHQFETEFLNFSVFEDNTITTDCFAEASISLDSFDSNE